MARQNQSPTQQIPSATSWHPIGFGEIVGLQLDFGKLSSDVGRNDVKGHDAIVENIGNNMR
jgi:hypothetical protein